MLRGQSRCALMAALMGLFALVSPLHAVTVGEKPTLRCTSTDGRPIDLRALRGKLVLVDFWTVNDAGRHFEAKLVELYKRYAAEGLAVVGICCDRDWVRSERFAKEMGMDWPHYWDGQMWNSPIVQQWTGTRVQTVLVAPDGAVLAMGSPQQLERELTRAFIQHPPQLVDPEVLASANRAVDAVQKSLGEHDRLAAIKAAAGAPKEATKDKVFARRWAEIDPQVQDAAKQLMAEVDALIKQRQYLTAAARLDEIIKALDGSSAVGEARQKQRDLLANPEAKKQLQAARRQTEADEALAAAKRLRAAQKDDVAYPRFKAMVRDYAGTAAAEEAALAVKAYEQDTALMARLKDQAVSGKAKAALSLARNYTAAQRYDLAADRYRRIIDDFAGTSYAETAREELAKLPPP